jgi:hypothetical protein
MGEIMPKKKFALESDGPQRLEIKWKSGWFYTARDVEVFLDGSLVGVIPHAEFGTEKEFHLPDDSNLRVSFMDGTLRVFRDGKSLAAIDHPRAALTTSYRVIFFIAVVGMLTGLLGLTGFKIVRDEPTINYVISFVCGVLFLLLGWWAKHKSRTAFVLSLLLYIVETVVWSVGDGYVSVNRVIASVIVTLVVVQGIRSIQKINKSQAVVQS